MASSSTSTLTADDARPRRNRRQWPRQRLSRLVLAAVLGAGALMVASRASAHVSIAESEHVAGSYSLLTFGVPHGCDDSPTNEIRIQLPELVDSVTPTVNPNWEVEVVTEELDEPITDSHGAEVTERDAEVVYTSNTALPDGLRDAFVLSLRIPDDAAGETLYFPTIQTCEQGETAWIEIPGEGQDARELDEPAPHISVISQDDVVEAAVEAPTVATGEPNDDESDGADRQARGLAIGALVLAAGGAGAGGSALLRQRRR